MIAAAIRRTVAGEHLDRQTMYEVFCHVMDGKTSDVQKSALLIALRMKGETAEEITGRNLAIDGYMAFGTAISPSSWNARGYRRSGAMPRRSAMRCGSSISLLPAGLRRRSSSTADCRRR